MAKVLHGGRFVDAPDALVRVFNLQSNKHGVCRDVYDEVTQSADYKGPTIFPDDCPACGAACIQRNEAKETHVVYRKATYSCGGGYTYKPQIQNHTTKYWGHCPATRARIEAVVKELEPRD